MSYIRTMELTTSQARELKALGFYLQLLTIGKTKDLYKVFVK